MCQVPPPPVVYCFYRMEMWLNLVGSSNSKVVLIWYLTLMENIFKCWEMFLLHLLSMVL